MRSPIDVIWCIFEKEKWRVMYVTGLERFVDCSNLTTFEIYARLQQKYITIVLMNDGVCWTISWSYLTGCFLWSTWSQFFCQTSRSVHTSLPFKQKRDWQKKICYLNKHVKKGDNSHQSLPKNMHWCTFTWYQNVYKYCFK